MAFPNPFNHSVSLRYLLTQNSTVSVQITDVTGRLISSTNLGKLPEGSHEWEWDGKDAKGNKMASGIYFYKIRADNFSYENKIIKRD